MPVDLSILIVNYNAARLVKKLLHSLDIFFLRTTALQVEVIVVDNGSHEKIGELRARFPHVKFIENGKNVGFAGGNNVGLKVARGRYVLLLNSDTEITLHSHLDKLVAYADQHEDVAVVTPKVILGSGAIDMASHRGEPTPWASLTYFMKLEKMFPRSPLFAGYHQTYKNFDTIHDIDACSGAAMLVRQTAIINVGPLDEQFFMYAEDLDWCRRFRDAGYRIVYFPQSLVVHHKYQSGRKNLDQKVAKSTTAYFYSTMLQYYDKYYRTHYPQVVRQGLQLFIDLKTKGTV